MDSVYVYNDNVTTRSTYVGTYCGRRLPPAIMSGPPGRLTVTFVSRPTSTGAGFSAQYGFVTGLLNTRTLHCVLQKKHFFWFTAK